MSALPLGHKTRMPRPRPDHLLLLLLLSLTAATVRPAVAVPLPQKLPPHPRLILDPAADLVRIRMIHSFEHLQKFSDSWHAVSSSIKRFQTISGRFKQLQTVADNFEPLQTVSGSFK